MWGMGHVGATLSRFIHPVRCALCVGGAGVTLGFESFVADSLVGGRSLLLCCYSHVNVLVYGAGVPSSAQSLLSGDFPSIELAGHGHTAGLALKHYSIAHIVSVSVVFRAIAKSP